MAYQYPSAQQPIVLTVGKTSALHITVGTIPDVTGADVSVKHE
jgi:hypothetical protein